MLEHIKREHIAAYMGAEGQGGGSCPCTRRQGSRCPWLKGGTPGRQVPPRVLQIWLPFGEPGALHPRSALPPTAALPPLCLEAMGCWYAQEDKSIPSCHSGLLWTLSWILWQCKNLVRQPLEIGFDFSGLWSSSQKTLNSYCILEIKLATFCTLLLIKRWLFAFYLHFQKFLSGRPVIFSLPYLYYHSYYPYSWELLR